MMLLVLLSQEGESAAMGDSAELLAGQEHAATAFLASRHEKGIKRVGIIYSPRKSWWAGMTFVVLSIVIFIITIVTAFVQ
jgi:hypothetical protein